MLEFQANKGPRTCSGPTRRDFLKAGSLGAGALSLSLAELNHVEAAAKKGDVNCILLFLIGAPSQLDTWDLKPSAPSTVHGPFKPIKTNVPGVEIGEHFPLMAKMADRYALLRSVYHKAAPIHETGHQMMQTGYLFRGGREYPHYGSVVSQLKGARPGGLPPFIVLPSPIGNTGVSVSHGQGAGYLGAKHEPFLLRGDPAAANFKVGAFSSPGGLDPARLKTRKALLEAVDDAHRSFDATEDSRARDSAYEKAFGLLFSSKTKKAFDIVSEKASVRDR